MTTNTILINEPLKPAEKAELEAHLTIIRTSFIAMVTSLATIHAKRLYRGEDGLRTWENFCRAELDFSARWGYYYIEAFTVLAEIESYNATSDTPLPAPTSLAQTRALAQTDLITTVWQATTARYGEKPTGKQITQTANDMTTEQALMLRGVTDGGVIVALSELAQKSDNGYAIVQELLATGYLQGAGDGEDAIRLQDVRVADLRRWEDDTRKEAIMRRVANEGGINVVIYPQNAEKTARALLGHLTTSQAYELSILLEQTRTSH